MQMNIDDIKISDQFLASHPSPEKMERFEKYWLLLFWIRMVIL